METPILLPAISDHETPPLTFGLEDKKTRTSSLSTTTTLRGQPIGFVFTPNVETISFHRRPISRDLHPPAARLVFHRQPHHAVLHQASSPPLPPSLPFPSRSLDNDDVERTPLSIQSPLSLLTDPPRDDAKNKHLAEFRLDSLSPTPAVHLIWNAAPRSAIDLIVLVDVVLYHYYTSRSNSHLSRKFWRLELSYARSTSRILDALSLLAFRMDFGLYRARRMSVGRCIHDSRIPTLEDQRACWNLEGRRRWAGGRRTMKGLSRRNGLSVARRFILWTRIEVLELRKLQIVRGFEIQKSVVNYPHSSVPSPHPMSSPYRRSIANVFVESLMSAHLFSRMGWRKTKTILDRLVRWCQDKDLIVAFNHFLFIIPPVSCGTYIASNYELVHLPSFTKHTTTTQLHFALRMPQFDPKVELHAHLSRSSPWI
ncbi:hypothetical protein SCHPADRAFT_119071 [Schizopora paradoxa]|uniref:Uncharacterized protein n=1 Tax=Schizopora paradoxa TaxID=27342 RepID=A0A0H2S9V7_9AGAM|nr:hypothetical protein SCHPADRAFT_119071 [Schizopora paradoxa]